MNDLEWVIAAIIGGLFLGTGIPIGMVKLLSGEWIWQNFRNEEKPTATPITGETRVNMPASIEKFNQAFNRATELNAAQPGRRTKRMAIEIEAAEPIVVEYRATMSLSEMSALKRVMEDWVNNHSGMPAYERELQACRDFLIAYRDKDRV